MNKYKWGVLIVFVIGLLVGLAVSRWTIDWRHPHGYKDAHYERMVKRFSKKLDLNEVQKKELVSILNEKREKIKILRKEVRPKFDQVRKATHDEIEKILNPQQIEKFRQWNHEKDKERKKKFSDSH